jgi:hypothetical protein
MKIATLETCCTLFADNQLKTNLLAPPVGNALDVDTSVFASYYAIQETCAQELLLQGVEGKAIEKPESFR